MQGAMPGVFTVNSTNQGVVLIGSTNKIAMPATKGIPSLPAQPGDTLTVYATGLGKAIDGVDAGQAAPMDRLVLLENKVTVMVGDLEIKPTFAGLAPGTAGLFQIDLVLPADSQLGPTVPFSLKVILPDGGIVEGNHVTIAIDKQ